MGYVLTTKNKIYVPDEVKQALGVTLGEMIDYEIGPDGQVFMIAAKQPNPPHATAKSEK